MAELTNRACLVAGDLNSRPPRPPDDPRRPSHQLGRAPHELDGRACVRPTCTMWCARVRMCVTVGSRRKCARRVLRRIVDPRGQNPSVESMCRVPGQWHRQWTALDLPLACVNMSLFCGPARDGLGVKMIFCGKSRVQRQEAASKMKVWHVPAVTRLEPLSRQYVPDRRRPSWQLCKCTWLKVTGKRLKPEAVNATFRAPNHTFGHAKNRPPDLSGPHL